MKRLFLIINTLALVAASVIVPGVTPGAAPEAKAYTNSRLIDNAIWDNVGTMNEAQIQSFLVARGSCLASFTDVEPSWNGSAWSYTGSVPASRIIYKAAQQWGLNPQVILATLQKEQSLITMNPCSATRRNSAMGYNCPDSGGLYDYPAIGIYGTCVQQQRYAGFTRQVLWGSWQLMFARQRSEGNIPWDGDNAISYGGYMTQGTFKRCEGCAPTYYNGYGTIDGQSVYFENGATASLYSYTPHLGQAFPGIFESWFGSTYAGPQCTTQTNVHRFWSKRFNNIHFYTANESERNTLMRDPNWTYEGVSFCALTSAQTGYAPVYRFWSPTFGNAHFFTANEGEKNNLLNDKNWRYQGVAFYAALDQSTDVNAKAIGRYWSPRFNNDHFYTGDVAERNALASDRNWISEGVGFYAIIP